MPAIEDLLQELYIRSPKTTRMRAMLVNTNKLGLPVHSSNFAEQASKIDDLKSAPALKFSLASK